MDVAVTQQIAHLASAPKVVILDLTYDSGGDVIACA